MVLMELGMLGVGSKVNGELRHRCLQMSSVSEDRDTFYRQGYSLQFVYISF